MKVRNFTSILVNEGSTSIHLSYSSVHGKISGAIDLAAVAEAAEGPKGRKAQKKGSKHHVDVALSVAQKSTASMGMFDKVHSYEPAPKMVRAAKKEAELAADVQKEKSQSMAVLNNILGITDNGNHMSCCDGCTLESPFL